MKVKVAEHSGYCFGVSRAMEMAERCAAEYPRKAFMLGEVIHNPRVIRDVKERKMRVAAGAEFDFPAGSVVLLPTHGTAKKVSAALKRKKVAIVDATCPRVLALHKKVVKALDAGKRVFIAGDIKHAETKALAEISPRGVRILGSPEEARKLRRAGRPCFLAAQTTFSEEKFRRIEETLRKKCAHLEVFNSICGHTSAARMAARGLARNCDIMIVIGGRNSANTARLREACDAEGAVTLQIEGTSELNKRDFSPSDTVGITAGASTPPGHIEEVTGWLSANFVIEDFIQKQTRNKTARKKGENTK